MSGHIFAERWYGFDDATYTAARLLEIRRALDPSAVLNALPTSHLDAGAERPLRRGERAGSSSACARRRASPTRARTDHDRRPARRVRGRLRPRARRTRPRPRDALRGHTPAALHRIEADFGGAARGQDWTRSSPRQRTEMAQRRASGRELARADRRCRRWATWCTRCRSCTTCWLPGRARVDWVVEEAFAPLVRRWRAWPRSSGAACAAGAAVVDGRRAPSGRVSRAASKARALRRRARPAGAHQSRPSSPGSRAGRGSASPTETDGSSYERPVRWLVDRAIRIEPHIHVVDRSRELARARSATMPRGAPVFGLAGRTGRRLRAGGGARARHVARGQAVARGHWIALGRRIADAGHRSPCRTRGAAERDRCAGASRRRSGRRRRSGLDWLSTRWSTGWPRRWGDRRRQRTQPRGGGARPAARADLQRPDAVAHRAPGGGTASAARVSVQRAPGPAWSGWTAWCGVTGGAAGAHGVHEPRVRTHRARRLSTVLRPLAPAYLVRLWWRGRREPLYRHAIGERLAATTARHRRAGFGSTRSRSARRVHAAAVGAMRCARVTRACGCSRTARRPAAPPVPRCWRRATFSAGVPWTCPAPWRAFLGTSGRRSAC